MNITFADTCWRHDTPEWNRELTKLLVALDDTNQHAILADEAGLSDWCKVHLPDLLSFLQARIAASNPRAHAVEIEVHPDGASSICGDPPWQLLPSAAKESISRPLRVVLENNESDKRFLGATVRGFESWLNDRWIEAEMGGGSAMTSNIRRTADSPTLRWRTYFVFDSDRLHPDELRPGWSPPSGANCQGHQFEGACAAMPAGRWHRLNRRSIENYLPNALLRVQNPQAAGALADPGVGEMAHFYNMKAGIAGDSYDKLKALKTTQIQRSGGFWRSLPDALQEALEHGFGSEIAVQFNGLNASDPWPPEIEEEALALADSLQDAM